MRTILEVVSDETISHEDAALELLVAAETLSRHVVAARDAVAYLTAAQTLATLAVASKLDAALRVLEARDL